MRIFSYIRFSSSNQTGNTSVETQRQVIAQFVAAMPELRGSLVTERRDEAKSATTLKGRTALESIMREATRGDAVVIFKYDRLGRNLLESLQTIKILEERGIAVYSTTEPNNEVVRNLLLTMAQEFSRQLGERCKRALDQRASGGHVANRSPFGYRIERTGPNSGGKFIPVETEAKLVRQIFEQRAAGSSLRAIIRELNNAGQRTRKDKHWQMTSARAILQNECYLGKTISGIRRYKKGHGLQGFRERKDWSICENAHEPLVTQELWDRVRARDENTGPRHTITPEKRVPFVWTGFLKCEECGANLIRHTSKGISYYGCDGGRKSGRTLACQRRSLVRVDVMDVVVMNALKNQVFNKDWEETVVGLFRDEIMKLTGAAQDILDPLEKTLTRLNQQVDTATKRLMVVPEDLFVVAQTEVKRLKAERDDLAKQIANTRQISTTEFDLNALEARLRGRLKRLWEAFEVGEPVVAREELLKHVERIEIDSNKNATLYPKVDGLLQDLGISGLAICNRQELLAPADDGMGSVYIPSGI